MKPDGRDIYAVALPYFFNIKYHTLQVIPLVPDEWQVAGLRLLYDISFFIIVTTIGLNIVFGIIVDTFSELRDERVRLGQYIWPVTTI